MVTRHNSQYGGLANTFAPFRTSVNCHISDTEPFCSSCHWLSEQTLVICATDLATGAPHIRISRLSKTSPCSDMLRVSPVSISTGITGWVEAAGWLTVRDRQSTVVSRSARPSENFKPNINIASQIHEFSLPTTEVKCSCLGQRPPVMRLWAWTWSWPGSALKLRRILLGTTIPLLHWLKESQNAYGSVSREHANWFCCHGNQKTHPQWQSAAVAPPFTTKDSFSSLIAYPLSIQLYVSLIVVQLGIFLYFITFLHSSKSSRSTMRYVWIHHTVVTLQRHIHFQWITHTLNTPTPSLSCTTRAWQRHNRKQVCNFRETAPYFKAKTLLQLFLKGNWEWIPASDNKAHCCDESADDTNENAPNKYEYRITKTSPTSLLFSALIWQQFVFLCEQFLGLLCFWVRQNVCGMCTCIGMNKNKSIHCWLKQLYVVSRKMVLS